MASHRVMAYTTNANGDIWSAFPTVNGLDGNFNFYYEWPNITEWRDLLQLPVAAYAPAVVMTVASTPGVQDVVGENSTITYAAEISNIEEDEAAAGVQQLLNGSDRLTYQSVTGASSFDCSAGNSCTIDIPTIGIDGTEIVTVTAVLDNDLIGIDQITTTTQLQTSLPLFGTDFILTHVVDTERPTVAVNTNPGDAIGTVTQTIFGSANDGDGAGIDFVEISLDGSSWQLASGTQSWTAELTAPSTAVWQIYARVTDLLGQVSAVSVVTVVEDTTAPTITPVVDSLLGGSSFGQLSGTTQDTAPTNAEVTAVAMQLDTSGANWNEGLVYAPQSGVQDWLYTWVLPYEDGVTHQVRFRATDYAGNETVSSWNNVIVDTIAPNVVVTTHNTQVDDSGTTPALIGTIRLVMGIRSTA
ncbi:MAG: hypothetical protein GY805_04450 [Chloroflexi bacterium]|nr:hypothetical protein [Chloroflexota bacterium]